MNQVILSDGVSYLSKDEGGRFTLTTNKEKATHMKEPTARNIVKHTLAHMKFLKNKKWKFIPVEDEKEQDAEPGKTLINPRKAKAATLEVSIPIEIHSYENEDESKLLQMVVNGLEAYCELESRREALNTRLYEETKSREDLEHLIENVRFNAYQGYTFCKELQTVSRNRRITKRNVVKLKAIHDKAVFPDVVTIRELLEYLKKVDEADVYFFRELESYGESVRRGQTIKSMKNEK